MQHAHRRFLVKALRRMFREVGQNYASEAVGKLEWFLEHTWTLEQEREFRTWFAAQAVKDLAWDKRYAAKQAQWFVLFYGWQLAASPEHKTKPF
jgi:hypothetical protein